MARRWRGEAALAGSAYAEAEHDFARAATLAQDVGRVRLQMDAQAALARLHDAQGRAEVARGHRAEARAIADTIVRSLASTELADAVVQKYGARREFDRI